MAVFPSGLPPPGSGQLEIAFRRLLLQCERRVQSDSGQPVASTSGDWRGDPKFHCYVETLQDQLHDLSHASKDRLPAAVLEGYSRHVRALASQLRPPDLPAFCSKPSKQDQVLAKATLGAGGGQGAAGARLPGDGTAPLSPRQASQAAPLQQQLPQTPQVPPGSGRGAGAGASQAPLSAEVVARLGTQQALQEELAGELVDMTAELKASTLAMQNAIRYRGKVLDEADTALVYSAEGAASAAAKAKQRLRASRSSLCQTFLLLLAMGLIFSGMLLYIRLTRMVGITGRSRHA